MMTDIDGGTIGTGGNQVVCGAANARAGMKSILARPGDFIPSFGYQGHQSREHRFESESDEDGSRICQKVIMLV